MLQITLARGKLLCGYGHQMDPSVDLEYSGQRGLGCRPSIFFGPTRDALHLVTRRLHAALLVRPLTMRDLETRTWVLGFPGGDPAVSQLWREQAENLGKQIRPQVLYFDLEQDQSHLDPHADIYQQKFRLAGSTLPDELRQLTVSIAAVIDGDALREQWKISGLHDGLEAQLCYWYQSEIGASVEMQSTIYYEKAQALCSYRGSVCFGLQASTANGLLPVAFAECGAAQNHRAAHRFGDLITSTGLLDTVVGFTHAGTLEAHPHWTALEPKSLCSLGATEGLISWHVPKDGSFELLFRLAQSLEDFESPLPKEALPRVRASDQEWLSQQKAAPAHLSPRLVELYHRTLLTLKQMQDPEGGIIAAPEFHYALTHCGGYGYCWGRDAGFISYAMDVCGMHAESAAFYRYMQRCQSKDGSFLHRHDMKGHLGSSWGLLQPDETGSVLFGLWQHVRLSGNNDLVAELRDTVQQAADWLANAKHSFDPELPIEGFDLWEEREGVHLYSVAAMAAGLDAAVSLYESQNWSVPSSWVKRASELRALINSPRFIVEGGQKLPFARTLRRRIPSHMVPRLEQLGLNVSRHITGSGRMLYELEQDFVLDISQVAMVYPYQILDLNEHADAFSSLLDQLEKALWRPSQGGLGRYEGDHYRDGNPWILTTLWLALTAAEQGKPAMAKRCWEWVLAHIPAEGMLPEQTDPENGQPSWVLPLTWSHAMFALAIHQLPKELLS